MTRTVCLSVLAALLLSGCSGQDGEPQTSSRQGSGVDDGAVFSTQVQAVEKARDVQRVLDASAARRQGQDTAP